MTRTGAGWRIASWAALAPTILIAVPAGLSRVQEQDLVGATMRTLALLLAFLLGAVGAACGFFGASIATAGGDRRLVVMLPVWLNLAFLLALAGFVFAPR